jgi:hypothetical protein
MQISDDLKAASGATLQIVQFNATFEGFGMVMDYLCRTAPFSGFTSKTLADALHQQLELGHHLVAMQRGIVVGYAGWLLTSQAIAEAWREDRDSLKAHPSAEVAALTIVAANERPVVTRLIRGARNLNPDVRYYFKRGGEGERPGMKRWIRGAG